MTRSRRDGVATRSKVGLPIGGTPALVQESTGLAAEKTKITVETLLQEADEIRQRAMDSHQYSAAIAAVREMGVLTGALIERNEVGQPDAFDELSDDQLLQALRERFNALGLSADDTRH